MQTNDHHFRPEEAYKPEQILNSLPVWQVHHEKAPHPTLATNTAALTPTMQSHLTHHLQLNAALTCPLSAEPK
jgi:hypothetical protein